MLSRNEMLAYNKDTELKAQEEFSTFFGRKLSKSQSSKVSIMYPLLGAFLFIFLPYTYIFTTHINTIYNEQNYGGLITFILTFISPIIIYVMFVIVCKINHKAIPYKFFNLIKGDILKPKDNNDSLWGRYDYAYIMGANLDKGSFTVCLFNNDGSYKINHHVSKSQILAEYRYCNDDDKTKVKLPQDYAHHINKRNP